MAGRAALPPPPPAPLLLLVLLCAALGRTGAFDVQVALRGSWPEVSAASLAFELLRRIDAAEAASLLLAGPLRSPEPVRERLRSAPREVVDFLREARALSPAVEAARAQCRQDRARYLPACRGPFSLRRSGQELVATCLVDKSAATSPASGEIVHDKDLLLRDTFGPRAVDAVLCASVAEAHGFVPSDADRVAFRYGDEEATATGDDADYVVGHAVELRVKKTEYSVVLDETAAAAVDDDDVADADAAGAASDGPSSADALERSAESVELSEGQLGNLPLQVSRLLLHSSAPLGKWKEIAENFPAYTKSLVTSKRPSKKVTAELSGSKAPFGAKRQLAVNGKVLPENFREAPFFHILDKVLEEVVALERRARGASTEVSVGAAAQRLDWRPASLSWHYHVKKDEVAEEWPSRITSLAKEDDPYDMYDYGMMLGSSSSQKEVKVRLPLVAVAVAFRPDDSRMLEVALSLLKPLAGKVSLLPLEGELPKMEWDSKLLGPLGQSAAAATKPPSSVLAGALCHAVLRGKAENFIGWLLKQKLPLSEAELKAGFFKHGDSNEKKAKAAWGKLDGAKPRNELIKLGLPVPSVLVNGHVFVPEESRDANSTAKDVRELIADEQQRFVEAVRAGSFKKGDEKSIESFALGSSDVSSPPLAQLPGARPCPALPGEALGAVPLLSGQGTASSGDAGAALFLQSAEDLAWLYPVALWLQSGGPSALSLVLSSDLPLRDCVAALARQGRLTSLARLGFQALQSGSLESEEEGQVAACSDAGGGGASGSGASAAREAEAEARLALAVRPLRGPALHCGGRLSPLPLPVPAQAVKALERQACPQPGPAEALAASAAPAIRWEPSLANLSGLAVVRAAGPTATDGRPAWLQVRGVVDPLAPEAPRLAAALEVVAARLGADVALQLLPVLTLSQAPLRKFTRSALPQLTFGKRSEGSGGPLAEGVAQFEALETEDILTMEVVAPSCWSVTARKSGGHDLDNLRKSDAAKTQGFINVEYELQSVYVEGSATHKKLPTHGLQLELLQGDVVLGETIVMKNHGYFALEGRFGEVVLRVKPGVSNDTFGLVESQVSAAFLHHSTDSAAMLVDHLLLPSFKVDFQLHPKRKAADLFDKTLGRAKKSKSRRARGAFNASLDGACPTVHVFSVASGHLYEKLLRIMMASVRKTTRCPVRFWFFDQFMSPDFKASMPVFAERLNVTFEFVAFKWPSWLRDDTGAHFGIRGDKQRLIWAHKILFLDVIFPLDLQRVIFVDADLVVRADLLELYTMDLEGAPYAFTPFCSGDRMNPDTTGYRFWQSGFWNSHLRSLPYHISALFVVDLAEFRRLSVGDRLREIYHGMSGDPNSLSNLDQDLPNFAQHQVTIKSLPEEWLWCESWCSNSSKASAKAIDLCQNPKTKEPKISMAKRVVEEWVDLDSEVNGLIGEGGGRPAAMSGSTKDEL